MSPRTRMTLGVSAIMLALLTACGSGGNALAPRSEPVPGPVSAVSTSPSTSTQAELKCEGDDCGADDKEIKTTVCNEPAVDVSPSPRLSTVAVDVAGAVVIRKSTAPSADCDSLYWAKLDDTGANIQTYVLTFTATDGQGRMRSVKQPSDNPSLEALSKAMKGRPGDTLEACVSGKPDISPVCVKVQVPIT